jgi:hypothetical protein
MAALSFPRGLTRERVVPRLIPFAVTIATPIVVGYIVRGYPMGQLEKASMAIIGAAAAIALSSRPQYILVAALSAFPVVYLTQPLLLKVGIAPGLVRATTFWKEALVGALLVTVWRHRERLRGTKLDAIDWAALVLLLLVVCYLAFPGLLPPGGAATTSDGRMLAFRNLAVIPLAVLLGRRLDIPSVWIRRGLTGLMIGGAIFGAFSLWEILANDSFKDFVDNTLGLGAADRILDRGSVRTLTETNVGGVLVQRAGSLIRLPNQAAFFFLPPVLVSVERLAREGANVWRVAAVAGASAGLILTQTRSAILGALVAVLVIVRKPSGLPTGVRVRFVMVLVMVGLAGAPFIAGSAIADRFSGAISQNDASSKAHNKRTPAAFRDALSHPFGHGLGSAGATARRFGRAAADTTAENYYIQVAQEVGLVGGVSFLVLFLTSLRRLFKSPSGGSGASTAALAALLGLGIAAFFLHAFDGATISLPLFTLVGIGLGAAATQRANEPAGFEYPELEAAEVR